MKKVLREMQTLHAGCSKNFHPTADPLPGGVRRPKFNQQMVIAFTYRPSLVKIDAHNFELLW